MAAVPALRECSRDLDSFTQYTGQCWIDSASTFLLFMTNIGERYFQDVCIRKELHVLVKLLQEWLDGNKAFVDSIAGFALSEEDYGKFREGIEDYLICLHKRYRNYLTKTRTEEEIKVQMLTKPGLRQYVLRRCDSFLYSVCQEGSGIIASEYLHESKREIVKANERRFPAIIAEYEANETRAQSKYKNLRLVSQRGYSLDRAGKLIVVLVAFFASLYPVELPPGSLVFKELMSEEEGIHISAYPNKYLILYSEDSLNEEYNKLMSRIIREKPEFIPLTRKGGSLVDLSTINNIEFCRTIPDSVQYSVTVAATTPKFSETEPIQRQRDGAHGLCFLGCANGENVVYDDNFAKVIPINWRLFLTKPIQNLVLVIEFFPPSKKRVLRLPKSVKMVAFNFETRYCAFTNGTVIREGTIDSVIGEGIRDLHDYYMFEQSMFVPNIEGGLANIESGEPSIMEETKIIIYSIFGFSTFAIDNLANPAGGAAGGASGGASGGSNAYPGAPVAVAQAPVEAAPAEVAPAQLPSAAVVAPAATKKSSSWSLGGLFSGLRSKPVLPAAAPPAPAPSRWANNTTRSKVRALLPPSSGVPSSGHYQVSENGKTKQWINVAGRAVGPVIGQGPVIGGHRFRRATRRALRARQRARTQRRRARKTRRDGGAHRR